MRSFWQSEVCPDYCQYINGFIFRFNNWFFSLGQGVIDLYFQEGEELVLVDYKTDRITLENRAELIEKISGAGSTIQKCTGENSG